MFGYATTLTTFSTRAAKNMLNSAISHTLRAPMLFFDTTPIGPLAVFEILANNDTVDMIEF
jgi:ATP-binding cassette subfamily C (CFTR/MRP) protein 1